MATTELTFYIFVPAKLGELDVKARYQNVMKCCPSCATQLVLFHEKFGEVTGSLRTRPGQSPIKQEEYTTEPQTGAGSADSSTSGTGPGPLDPTGEVRSGSPGSSPRKGEGQGAGSEEDSMEGRVTSHGGWYCTKCGVHIVPDYRRKQSPPSQSSPGSPRASRSMENLNTKKKSDSPQHSPKGKVLDDEYDDFEAEAQKSFMALLSHIKDYFGQKERQLREYQVDLCQREKVLRANEEHLNQRISRLRSTEEGQKSKMDRLHLYRDSINQQLEARRQQLTRYEQSLYNWEVKLRQEFRQDFRHDFHKGQNDSSHNIKIELPKDPTSPPPKSMGSKLSPRQLWYHARQKRSSKNGSKKQNDMSSNPSGGTSRHDIKSAPNASFTDFSPEHYQRQSSNLADQRQSWSASDLLSRSLNTSTTSPPRQDREPQHQRSKTANYVSSYAQNRPQNPHSRSYSGGRGLPNQSHTAVNGDHSYHNNSFQHGRGHDPHNRGHDPHNQSYGGYPNHGRPLPQRPWMQSNYMRSSRTPSTSNLLDDVEKEQKSPSFHNSSINASELPKTTSPTYRIAKVVHTNDPAKSSTDSGYISPKRHNNGQIHNGYLNGNSSMLSDHGVAPQTNGSYIQDLLKRSPQDYYNNQGPQPDRRAYLRQMPARYVKQNQQNGFNNSRTSHINRKPQPRGNRNMNNGSDIDEKGSSPQHSPKQDGHVSDLDRSYDLDKSYDIDFNQSYDLSRSQDNLNSRPLSSPDSQKSYNQSFNQSYNNYPDVRRKGYRRVTEI